MRPELDILQQWIRPGARVLDLGCGDGSLLAALAGGRQVHGYGLEIDPYKISLCLERGVNVIEQDLDRGLGNFQTESFDTVVMSQTLQAVRYPHLVLDEMLRIGRECIITFPNFGNWRCRLHITGKGRMPVSRFMPYTWYDTPNIHFCTVLDFESLCRDKNIHVINRAVVDARNRASLAARLLPNVFGMTAIYHVTR
jgi:methionine biosynthesis protein MetW